MTSVECELLVEARQGNFDPLQPRDRLGRWRDIAHFVHSLKLGGVHLVGGAVRDAQLGKAHKDADFIVLGKDNSEIKAALEPHGKVDDLVVAERPVGVRFHPSDPEARALAPDGIEFVPPRTERSTGPGRHDFEIVADKTVPFEEDAKRRDFTINAMAQSLEDGKLLDPLGGSHDAETKTLRVVGDNTFAEDPLRIVRGLRFVSQHDLTPDANTLALMREYAPQVEHLSGERVGQEMDKLLMGAHPAKALRIARDTGVLQHLFPELSAISGFDQQSRYHALNADEHTFEVVQSLADHGANLNVRWAGLFHDSGKPEAAWEGPDGRLHYYANDQLGKLAHEVVGAEKAAQALSRTNHLTTEDRKRVVDIVKGHMFRDHDKPDPVRARRFLDKHGETLALDLLDHKRGDIAGKESDADERVTRDLGKLAEFGDVVRDQLATGQPYRLRDLAITGHDLLALGVKPGPVVGETLGWLKRQVIANPSLNNPDWLRAEAGRYQARIGEKLDPGSAPNLGPQVYMALPDKEPPRQSLIEPVKGGSFKPYGGLWTSSRTPEGSTAWRDWAGYNMPHWVGKEYDLTPSPDARVLDVHGASDLDKLAERYPSPTPLAPLDWEKLAEDYDAVHFDITDWSGYNRADAIGNLMYGIDAESTVWFRPKFKEQLAEAGYVETQHLRTRAGRWRDMFLPRREAPSSAAMPSASEFNDIYQDFEHNGIRVRPGLVPYNNGDGSVTVSGVLTADGKDVGSAEATLFRSKEDGKLAVYRDLVNLKPEYQGRGFATALYQHEENELRALGVDRVELAATLSVGGYAWARAGFEFARGIESVQTLWRIHGPRAGNPLRKTDFTPRGEDWRQDQLAEIRQRVGEDAWSAFEAKFPKRWDWPSPDFPRPEGIEPDPNWFQHEHEIAAYGRDGVHWEQDGHDMWLGKAFLLGSAWAGVKHLQAPVLEAAGSPEVELVGRIHDDYARRGKLLDPPDVGEEDEAGFWDEVERALGGGLTEAAFEEILHPRNRHGRFVRVFFKDKARKPLYLQVAPIGEIGIGVVRGVEADERGARGSAQARHHWFDQDEIARVEEQTWNWGEGADRLVPRTELTDGPAADHLDILFLSGDHPWVGQLTGSEHDALAAYLHPDGFKAINSGLRSGDLSGRFRLPGFNSVTGMEVSLPVEKWIAHLDSAISKAPPTDVDLKMFLFRGVRDLHAVFGPDGPKVGQVVPDEAYTSTTTEVEVARGFAEAPLQWQPGPAPAPAVVEIKLPDGIHGAWMGGAFSVGQTEFVLPRGSTFEVTDVGSEPGREVGTTIPSIELRWVPPLSEAVEEYIEREHPRGRAGKWVEKFGVKPIKIPDLPEVPRLPVKPKQEDAPEAPVALLQQRDRLTPEEIAARRAELAAPLDLDLPDAADVRAAIEEEWRSSRAKGDPTKARAGAGFSPRVETKEDLEALVVDIDRRLREGYPYAKGWYQDSGRSILAYSHGNVDQADMIAQLFAIYSPQKPVAENLALAFRVYEEYHSHGIKPRFGGKDKTAQALQALEGGNFLEGRESPDLLPKVRRFYANILKHIDSDRMRSQGFTGREVTGDGWMGAAWGFGANTASNSLTRSQIEHIERITQALADHHGLSAEDAQAAIWTSIKAQNDDSIALGRAYADPATREGALSQAGESFADSLFRPQYTLRLPIKALTEEKPFTKKLTAEQARLYTAETGDGVVDALRLDGFVCRQTDGGLGFRLNENGDPVVVPGTAVEIAIGDLQVSPRGVPKGKSQPDPSLYFHVSDEQRAFYGGLSAAIGANLKAQRAAWHRRISIATRGKSDATMWRAFTADGDGNPRPPTGAELEQVAKLLDHENWHATVHHDGLTIAMNNPDPVLDRAVEQFEHNKAGRKEEAKATRKLHQAEMKKRQAHIDSVLDNAIGPDVKVTTFAHRGNLVPDDAYLSATAGAGRSDLLGRVGDRVSAGQAAIDKRWQADPEGAAASYLRRQEHGQVGQAALAWKRRPAADLLEAKITKEWTERLHPRDREGKFRKSVMRTLRKLVPSVVPSKQEPANAKGRHVWLRGRRIFVPRDKDFRETLDHQEFTSPAGGTNIYRNGYLVQVEGQDLPHHQDLNPPGVKVVGGGTTPKMVERGDVFEPGLPAVAPKLSPEAADAALLAHQAGEQARTELADRISTFPRARNQAPDAPPILPGTPQAVAEDVLQALGFVTVPGADYREDGRLWRVWRHSSDAQIQVISDTDTGQVTDSEFARGSAPLVAPEPLDRAPRTWSEFEREIQGLAWRLAHEYGVTPLVADVLHDPMLGDHAGSHNSISGVIRLGDESKDALARGRATPGKELDGGTLRSEYASYKVGVHEALHGAGPIISPTQYAQPAYKAIEEALVEELAHIETVKLLRAHGQTDVLAWARRNPTDWKVTGSYEVYRARLDAVLTEAGIAPELREERLRELKFGTDPGAGRTALLADWVAANPHGHFAGDRESALTWVVTSMGREQLAPTTGAYRPQIRPDLRDMPDTEGFTFNGKRVGYSAVVSVYRGGQRGDPVREQHGTVVGVQESRVPGFKFALDVRWENGIVSHHIMDAELADVVQEAPVAPLELGDGLSVAPGDLVRYDGRADGGMSEARVSRVRRGGKDWEIEAVTTDNSLKPERLVMLTDRRVGQIERVEEAPPVVAPTRLERAKAAALSAMPTALSVAHAVGETLASTTSPVPALGHGRLANAAAMGTYAVQRFGLAHDELPTVKLRLSPGMASELNMVESLDSYHSEASLMDDIERRGPVFVDFARAWLRDYNKPRADGSFDLHLTPAQADYLVNQALPNAVDIWEESIYNGYGDQGERARALSYRRSAQRLTEQVRNQAKAREVAQHGDTDLMDSGTTVLNEMSQPVTYEWDDTRYKTVASLAAKRDGEVVGRLYLYWTRDGRRINPADESPDELLAKGFVPHVHMIKVEEPYRRQGIATALFAEGRRRWPTLRHTSNLTDEGKVWLGSLPAELHDPGTKLDPGAPETVERPHELTTITRRVDPGVLSAYRLRQDARTAEQFRNGLREFDANGALLPVESDEMRQRSADADAAALAAAAAEDAAGGRVYRVSDDQRAKLDAQLKKLAKSASKLGLAEPTVTEVGDEWVERREPNVPEGMGERQRFSYVQVAGEEPKIAGWDFLASLQNVEGSNIIRRVPGSDEAISLDAYRHADPVCDYCKTKRDRKLTYVVHNDAEGVKRVGSSCIRDFLGHGDPAAIAAYMENWHALEEIGGDDGYEDEGGGGGGGKMYVPTEAYLTHVATMLRENGWVSRSAAGPYSRATADVARENHFNYVRQIKDRGKPMWVEPTADDEERAKAALEWARTDLAAKPNKSEFDHNMVTMAKAENMPDRGEGILAYVVVAHSREIEREIEQRRKAEISADSKHVGTVGERMTVRARVESIFEREGDYGTTFITKLVDDQGNHYKWFGSSELERDKVYEGKFTVKKHDAYKGVNETVLTRPTGLAEYDPDAPPPVEKPTKKGQRVSVTVPVNDEVATGEIEKAQKGFDVYLDGKRVAEAVRTWQKAQEELAFAHIDAKQERQKQERLTAGLPEGEGIVAMRGYKNPYASYASSSGPYVEPGDLVAIRPRQDGDRTYEGGDFFLAVPGTDNDKSLLWVPAVMLPVDPEKHRDMTEHIGVRMPDGVEKWLWEADLLVKPQVSGEKADPGDGRSLTPGQRKAYDTGWRSGQTPTYKKVENADNRREHSYWYLGYFDAEGGRDKYESVPAAPTPDELAAELDNPELLEQQAATLERLFALPSADTPEYRATRAANDEARAELDKRGVPWQGYAEAAERADTGEKLDPGVEITVRAWDGSEEVVGSPEEAIAAGGRLWDAATRSGVSGKGVNFYVNGQLVRTEFDRSALDLSRYGEKGDPGDLVHHFVRPPMYPPSDYLTMPKSGKLVTETRSALEAVDGLLRVPPMVGPIPVRATSGKNTRGGYLRKADKSQIPIKATWNGPTVRLQGGVGEVPAKRADELVPDDLIYLPGGHQVKVVTVEPFTKEIGFGRPPVERVNVGYVGESGPQYTNEYKSDELIGWVWPLAALTTQRPPDLTPTEIRVSTASEEGVAFDVAATLIHELGHYLDNQAFRPYPQHRGMASTHAAWRATDPEKRAATIQKSRDKGGTVEALEEFERSLSQLSEWYDAVNASPEVEELAHDVPYTSMATHKYLLSPTELWARSFAQWVAIRSGDPRLMKWLREHQAQPETMTAYRKQFDRATRKNVQVPYEAKRPPSMLLRQWTDENFEPIAEVMDRTFDRLGWLHGGTGPDPAGAWGGRDRDSDLAAGRDVGARPGGGSGAGAALPEPAYAEALLDLDAAEKQHPAVGPEEPRGRAVQMTPEEFADAARTWWHGTQYGSLLDEAPWTSGQGFHVGSYEAAREALAARSGWDLGPREQGAGRYDAARADLREYSTTETENPDGSFTYLSEFPPGRFHSSETVRFDGDYIDVLDYSQTEEKGRTGGWAAWAAKRAGLGLRDRGVIHTEAPTYPQVYRGAGKMTHEPPDAVPDGPLPAMVPVWITGPMSNTRSTPHDDWAANGRMRSLLKRGQARRGYYYKNEAEDAGSISAVLPSRAHVRSHEDFVREAVAQGEPVPQSVLDRYPNLGEKSDPGYAEQLAALVAEKPLREHGPLAGYSVEHSTIGGSAAMPQTFHFLTAENADGVQAGVLQWSQNDEGAWVNSITVSPGFRGQGIAYGLVKELHEETGKPIIHGSFVSLDGIEFGVRLAASAPEWNKLWLDAKDGKRVFWEPGTPVTDFDFAKGIESGDHSGMPLTFLPLKYNFYRRANATIDRALAKAEADLAEKADPGTGLPEGLRSLDDLTEQGPPRNLVEDALQSWVGWPSDMRIHMARELEGAPRPGAKSGWQTRDQAAALMQELRVNGRTNPVPLYRGEGGGFTGFPGIPTSWSESRAVARGWAKKSGGRVVELPPGQGHGIRVADYISSQLDQGEKQWLLDVQSGGAAEKLDPGGEAWRVPLAEYAPEVDYDRPEFDAYIRRELPPEQQEAMAAEFQAQRERKQEWMAQMRKGLSLGKVSLPEAKALGFHATSHEVENEYVPGTGWGPLPQDLWHVTTAASAVRAQGLKTRDELGQERGLGLGGGNSDTISFTTDPKIAADIERGLRDMRAAVRGELTVQKMIEQAGWGQDAASPWLMDWLRGYGARDWRPGAPLPREVQDAQDGVQRGTLTALLDTEEKLIAQLTKGDEFRPGGTGWHLAPGEEPRLIGGDGKPRYLGTQFVRPLTALEQAEKNADLLRSWLTWREQHGGPADPLFFLSNMLGLADVPPDEIQTLRVRPRPGAQGYPMGGMMEWRTNAGGAVELAEPAPWSDPTVGEKHDYGDAGEYDEKLKGHWSGDTTGTVYFADKPGVKLIDGRDQAFWKMTYWPQTGEHAFWIPDRNGRPHHDDVRERLDPYSASSGLDIAAYGPGYAPDLHDQENIREWAQYMAVVVPKEDLGYFASDEVTPEEIEADLYTQAVRGISRAASWHRSDMNDAVAMSGEKYDPGGPTISVPDDPAVHGLNRNTDNEASVHGRWVDQVHRDTGQLPRGNPISPTDPRIPETLYHATTNLPAVESDGYLRARGAGGLGGDNTDRIVSLTADSQVANQIAADLHLLGTLGRAFPTMPDYSTNKVPVTADDPAWMQNLTDGKTVLGHERVPENRRVIAWLQDRAREQGFQFLPDAATYDDDHPSLETYDIGDWMNQWFNERASKTGVQNPVVFNTSETARSIDPDKVGVVSVPRASLDNGALITDFDLHKSYGLKEIRVYGDVAVKPPSNAGQLLFERNRALRR